ncbi:MAG: threonylcarbamoyl-AMP synthase [Propionibacteriaceae bacterium]|nr:threonylcarbamoyl-AMP synthase [Propionibacteriaceae bacterium]
MANVIDIDAQGEQGLRQAAEALKAGKLVVFPTDTVYGIAADAFNDQAVSDLLAAKGRGRDMPPPLMLADPSMLKLVADPIPEAAMRLAEAYWPGALTLVLETRMGLELDLGDLETVAVRVPDHEYLRELLRRTGPLAVSSANRSGLPAATTAFKAEQMLGDSVAVYLDGGVSDGNAVSTIVSFVQDGTPKILRQGKLSAEQISTAV